VIRHFDTPHWHAEFTPEQGGQLIRLRHLPTSRDILHHPATPEHLQRQPERYGIPLLFPPNRVADGRFFWHGHHYALPLNEPARRNHIHGITLNQPWTFVTETNNSAAPDRVTLTFTHTPEHATYTGYPHRFRIELSHEFFPNEVRQTVRLQNLDKAGDSPQPYGLGFHTAFHVPVSAGARLRITAARDAWELDPDSRLPTGRKIPFPLGTGGGPFASSSPITGAPLSCHVPLTTEATGAGFFRGAVIEFPEEDLRVAYEIGEDFRHWFLWTPPDEPDCLCLEPMTWMVNAPNLVRPPEVTGLMYLESGDTREFRARIVIDGGLSVRQVPGGVSV
jgi:aldose 1-epimerase